MLSPRSFIPLCFKSVIDFELIFKILINFCGKKNFLHVVVQLFQSHFLNRLPFVHCTDFLFLYPISVDYIYGGLLPGSLFCDIDLFVISSITHCPDYHNFTVKS